MGAADGPHDEQEELARLRAAARDWAAGDPDPVTRQALRVAADAGDLAELRAALATPLAFGTAGMRGPVGPGPARMNRAMVIRVTWGLAQHVLASDGELRPVVVGHDARPDSARFAADVVAVLAGAGLPVHVFDEPVPTPVVAHAARAATAAAAVVVTASHNPPADNGYKVYGPDAIQIVPPTDAAIAAAAADAPPATEILRAAPDDARISVAGPGALDEYLAAVLDVRVPGHGPTPTIAYTPLHGVAGALATRALAAAGHDDVHVVASQAEPDGAFPTLASPNPEDPTALAAVLDLAAAVDADLVLANDPDGDRLAVAVRDDAAGGHRVLTGNQVGVLLGDHLLAATDVARPVVASSVVSSPMFAEIARERGARHEVTLTGFKWICRAAQAIARQEGGRAVLGYEEALGYAVGDLVLDKDGISAAVVIADLARALAATGRTVGDRLEDLAARHGLWVSTQVSASLSGPDAPDRIVAALDAASGLAGRPLGAEVVTGVVDHRRAAGAPPWRGPADLVELALEHGGRALLRPSGTEPKVKAYVDLRTDRGDAPIHQQEAQLRARADEVAHELLVATSLA